MMAGTAKGKQVRWYFLDCEAELKRRIEEDRQNSKDRIIKLLVCDAHATWKPRFEEQFFKEAYRVIGYKRLVKSRRKRKRHQHLKILGLSTLALKIELQYLISNGKGIQKTMFWIWNG